MAISIIKDAFISISIIIAAVTLGTLLVRDKIAENKHSLINTMLIGGLTGLLGCVLMIFNFQISDTIIVDFRCLPIMMMGLYYSLSAASVTAGIVGVFRIVFFGWSAASGISLVVALLMAVACGLIGRLNIKLPFKWVISYVSVALISGLGFWLVLRDNEILVDLLVAFNHGLLSLSFFTYFFMQYILKMNRKYYVTEEAYEKDYLTGLKNIRFFDNAFNKYMKEAKSNEPVSLLYIDIDFFKKVNDLYGHVIGDKILYELSTLLENSSREPDIVARRGGEEFTILLKSCKLDNAVKIAQRIIYDVAEHKFLMVNNIVINITVSIGIASYPETTVEVDKLIEQADIALYNAKRSGRNRYCVANRLCDESQ
jgi:diguanylate cyclase